MIAAALEGRLDQVETMTHVFGLEVPALCAGIPDELWDVRVEHGQKLMHMTTQRRNCQSLRREF